MFLNAVKRPFESGRSQNRTWGDTGSSDSFTGGRSLPMRGVSAIVSERREGELTGVQGDPSYVPCEVCNQMVQHQCKNYETCTLLAFGVQETRQLGSFELWKQQFTDDGQHVEGVAFFNLEKRPDVGGGFCTTPIGV